MVSFSSASFTSDSVACVFLWTFADIYAVELSASFIVWAASPEAEFLKGKLVWSNWDVDELKAKKAEIEGTLELTIGLIGWA